MYTNRDLLQIAMKQSALDINGSAADFTLDKNVLITGGIGPCAKKYYSEPIGCTFISYGSNIVAATKEELKEIVSEYISLFKHYHCFGAPNIHWLDEKIKPLGYMSCFMSEYFLPDLNKLSRLDCSYELKVLESSDFDALYLPEWSNALSIERKELDILGVGAYDNGKLIGLAGCSADCEEMWQIGVDVLPEYRLKGIASALTSNLAVEILSRDKVPFYCCAWSNVRSAKNAVKSGFSPAWVELSVKPLNYIAEIIH